MGASDADDNSRELADLETDSIPELTSDKLEKSNGTRTPFRVVQLDATTNRVIQVYDSVAVAAEALSLPQKAKIYVACKHRNVAFGYKWRYEHGS